MHFPFQNSQPPDPDGQSESLQHSRQNRAGHTPQQFPESQLLSTLHVSPFGAPETWLSNATIKTQNTKNLGCKYMIPCTSNTSIQEGKLFFFDFWMIEDF